MKKEVFFLVMTVCILPLCVEDRKSGGPCTYDSYEGICRITGIEQGYTNQGDPSGVNLLFNYTPADTGTGGYGTGAASRTATAYAPYLGIECLNSSPDPLTVEDVKQCNITDGTTYRCTLKTMTSGSCSPEIYNFYEQTT